jgi:hypothetical protein
LSNIYILNSIGDVMVSMLALSAIDPGFKPWLGQGFKPWLGQGFKPWLGQTNEIGICCFSANLPALIRNKSKD